MYVPENKRRGMLHDVTEQLAAAERGESVEREEVERLVGLTFHLAQVAAEGNAYLLCIGWRGPDSGRVGRFSRKEG